MNSNFNNKNSLRQKIKEKLNIIKKESKEEYLLKQNKEIFEKLKNLIIQIKNENKNLNKVAIYIPTNNEIDILEDLFTFLSENKFEILLPIWNHLEDKNKQINKTSMEFIKIEERGYKSFVQNLEIDIINKNYKKPKYNRSLIEIPNLIILPCVGFNEDNFRLGNGAGHYDRYLNWHKETNIATICLAYEEQKLEEKFQEEHDIKMNYIITQKKVYTE